MSMSLAGYSAALGPTLFCTQVRPYNTYTDSDRLNIIFSRIIECSLAIIVGCAPAVRSYWTTYERDHALGIREDTICTAKLQAH